MSLVVLSENLSENIFCHTYFDWNKIVFIDKLLYDFEHEFQYQLGNIF